MIAGLRVLAVVPARGGSKGLPRKNVLPLAGKPLLAWTLQAAQASRYLDRTILSSDDDEIIATGQQYGGDAPFKRPTQLAVDTTTTLDVVFHVLEQFPAFDIVVILQPTSPLRSAADIDAALEHLIDSGARSCVSVTEPDKSPYWCYGVNEQGRLAPLLDSELASRRRQDLPTAYTLNGAVYAAHVDWLKQQQGFVGTDTVAHVMPRERSLDIDTLLDMQICEAVIAAKQSTAVDSTGNEEKIPHAKAGHP
jgi:N-acylneuraminate cytidylyltransferase